MDSLQCGEQRRANVPGADQGPHTQARLERGVQKQKAREHSWGLGTAHPELEAQR